MTRQPTLDVKRVYDPRGERDGLRVLVDGIWPRGLSKNDAALDHWCKAVAPSAALRRWFAHDRSRWDAFRRRYFAELDDDAQAVGRLRSLLDGAGHATLLFAAKDTECNNARALLEYLERGRRT